MLSIDSCHSDQHGYGNLLVYVLLVSEISGNRELVLTLPCLLSTQHIVSKQQVALERVLRFFTLATGFGACTIFSIHRDASEYHRYYTQNTWLGKPIAFCEFSVGNCELCGYRENAYLYWCIPHTLTLGLAHGRYFINRS